MKAKRNETIGLVAGFPIEGLEFRELTMHHDERGAFTEVFQDYWNTVIKPVQWSVVKTAAGVFRGMHLHLRHEEYFALLVGRACVGVRDIRQASSTSGRWALYEFSGESLACITFPKRILHGWYFHTDAFHLQAVSEAYRDYHADDNLGCRWDDPDLEIPWPFRSARLAPAAREFPPLKELMPRIEERL